MTDGRHNPRGSCVFHGRGVYLLDSLATRHAFGERGPPQLLDARR